jgi:2-desacetyl-2-hydroxyethyl bacteriochlorophyllide A dehydrogenase
MVLREYDRPLVYEDVPEPSPKRNEIVVKVHACGMCFTDVKIQTGQLSGFITLPHIPGHEIAGTVVEAGEDVKGVKVGDRGICHFLLGCRNCDLCRRGSENLCLGLSRIGFEHPGGYAEYVAMPEYSFCPFEGEETSFEKMAILPDAVATPYHALNRLAALKPGETVLVVGVGGLGIHAVQIAALMGATVLAADLKKDALETAKAYGADHLVDAGSGDPLGAVRSFTGGTGVDVVLEGVGKASTMAWTLPSLKKGGRLIVMGYDPVNPVPVNLMNIHNNEWSIQGAKVSSKQELVEVVRLVEKKKIRPVVSVRFGLKDANDALNGVRSQKVMGRTVLVMDR